MLCRLLLAVFIVTYLICVLVLNGIQKEDLDVSMLEKLQRHNVNTNKIFNNEQVKQDCIQHHLQNAVNVSHLVYSNSTSATPKQTVNHSVFQTIAPKAKSEDINDKENVVFSKLSVKKNGTNNPNHDQDSRKGYILLKGYPKKKQDDKSIFQYNLNDASIIPDFLKLYETRTTTEMTQEIISEYPYELTHNIKEEIEATTAILHTMEDNHNSLQQIEEPNNVIPHTKIGVNEKEQETNSQLTLNLDSYIKDQIQKYLSTDKTKSKKVNTYVSQDVNNSTCTESQVCEPKKDHIHTKLQLVQDLTTKAVNDVANLSKGQLILNMNLLNRLADNIKDVILKDLQKELKPTSHDSDPLINTTPGIIAASLSVTALSQEITKEETSSGNEKVDAVAKLMDLLDIIRPPRTTTTLKPTIPPNMPIQNIDTYAYKTVYTVYHNPQHQSYGFEPPYNELKHIYSIHKSPFPIPQVSYLEQPPANLIPMLPHELPTLPIIMPKVVLDTKNPLETVQYDYTYNQYEAAKQKAPGIPQGSGTLNHQEYDRGKIKSYELPNPQVQECVNPPVQFKQLYITAKPDAEPYETPKPQEYVHAPITALNSHSKPQNGHPQPQSHHPPVQPFRPRQYEYAKPNLYDYPNIHQNAQFQTQDQKVADPKLIPKNYWLPPVVSYDSLNKTVKHIPVPKIQTNYQEIPPLRIISAGHPVYQNIIVPKTSLEKHPKWRTRSVLPTPKPLPGPLADSSAEHWERIRHQMQSNIEDTESNRDPLSPRLDDIWHYNQNHYGNGAKYHVQLEQNNQDPLPAPIPHHHHVKEPDKTEHNRVASRQQMPYAHNHIFADKHIKKLMKSQQRISDILEKVLSLNKMIDDTSSQLLS